MSYLTNLGRQMDAVETPYYVEYDNDNCTVVKAANKRVAREMAKDSRWRITLLREATTDDIVYFESRGGMIR